MDYYFKLLMALESDNDTVYHKFLEMLVAKSFVTVKQLADYMIKFKLYGSDLMIAQTGKYDAVTLTTAHTSKGKEWDIVYNTISMYDVLADMEMEEIEETNRLLFVSLTRAKKELYVTGTEFIGAEDNPNRHTNKFFNELKSGPVDFDSKIED